MKRLSIIALALIGLVLSTTKIQAQGNFVRGRLVGNNGQWILPFDGILGSDDDDHTINRSPASRTGYAWDLIAPYATYVRPIADGVVSYAGCIPRFESNGCQVTVDHDDGYASFYGHLIDEGDGDYRNGGVTLVQVGDKVTRNTVIGRVGWSGKTSFGPHTHFGIRKGTGKNPLYWQQVRTADFFDKSKLTYDAYSGSQNNPFLSGSKPNFTPYRPRVNVEQIHLNMTFTGEYSAVFLIFLVSLGSLLWQSPLLILGKQVLRLSPQINRITSRKFLNSSVGDFLLPFLTIPVTFAVTLATGLWLLTSSFSVQNSWAFSNSDTIPWMPESVTRWWPEFEKASRTHDVPTQLIAAVVLAESCGDPSARSIADAVGLMQLMDGAISDNITFRKLDPALATLAKDPKHPEVNIDFGAWYLARQLKAFGTVIDTAGAYNGGPGTMRAHIESGAPLDHETIRYREWITGFIAESNNDNSPTFTRWLDAGGRSMCIRAANS